VETFGAQPREVGEAADGVENRPPAFVECDRLSERVGNDQNVSNA
jgi:hypothetical protein